VGGYGSGRTAWRNQGVVEGCHSLDVLALRREADFGPAAVGVTVPYTDMSGAAAEQYVRITWTGCRFGGFRPWFECPGCGSRRVKLYREQRVIGGEWRLGRALCRGCLRLAYWSQRETTHGRRLLRCQRIVARLGGSGVDPPPKPKAMHWKTYNRQVDEAEAAWREALAGALAGAAASRP
jgi:hypothetical protein